MVNAAWLFRGKGGFIVNNSQPFRGSNLLTGNRNFLLLFLGRLVSSTGSAVFFLSILWMAANEMGGSASVSFILTVTVIPSGDK